MMRVSELQFETKEETCLYEERNKNRTQNLFIKKYGILLDGGR